MTPACIDQLKWILERSVKRAELAWHKVDIARGEALRLGHEAQAIADIIKLHELELKEKQVDAAHDYP